MTDEDTLGPDGIHRVQSQPQVYLAGPIQHADDGGHGWRDMVIGEYSDSFDFINPLDFFDGGEDTATILPKDVAEEYKPAEDENVITDEQVVKKDTMLVNDADALLIGYHEKVPAWGTPFEQALVSNRSIAQPNPRIPVAVWHSDLLSSELSPWLRYNSTYNSRKMRNVMGYLEAVLGTAALCVDCRKTAGVDLQGSRFKPTEDRCEECRRNTAVEVYGGGR